MKINIGAYGRGLAAILGVGAIILAIMENSAWKTFLLVAVIVWFLGFFLGQAGKKSRGRKSKRVRTRGRR